MGYEQLFRGVFLCFGVKKIFENFLKNILHKIKFKKKFLILGKKFMNFEHELSPSKPLLRSTQSLILGIYVMNEYGSNVVKILS